MAELAANRRAYHDYSILEKFEAGVELYGHEVKAIKSGRVNIAGTHVAIRKGEAWLVGADIPPYQPKNILPGYEPQRDRKLLLNRKELDFLSGRTREKGLTVVPLKLYTTAGNRATIKLEIGLVRSKKEFDKRELLKKREVERNIRREI
jgi:SsrA-binding protein